MLALYRDLHPQEDAAPDAADVFATILSREDLTILLLEVDGSPVATTYLNIIPNLTRGAAPYAVIENVVVAKAWQGKGLGKRLMAATLEAAWKAGCYKVMLLTGSKTPSTHAYYRACGFDPTAKQAYLARPPYQVRIHNERKSQPGVPSGAESNRHTGASCRRRSKTEQLRRLKSEHL
ncbi:MAG: GNAT family N-acetyltransferase [Dermatophilaceae bacterium]|nr:GNAT family N-acetyltransferase [Dermatophilaceae bacterium]